MTKEEIQAETLTLLNEVQPTIQNMKGELSRNVSPHPHYIEEQIKKLKKCKELSENMWGSNYSEVFTKKEEEL